MAEMDGDKPGQARFPESGLVRLSMILAPTGPLPISKSQWWAGVRDGIYPQPIRLGPRITCWRAEDIHQLMKNGVRASPGHAK